MLFRSGSEFKRCTIRKEYFGYIHGTQYFYVQHSNKYTSIFYELSPIQIIMPRDDEIIMTIDSMDKINNWVRIGQKGVLHFLTNYQDYKNIFDNDKNENNTFDSQIIDNNNNEYNVRCKFLKTNDTISIVCNLNDNLNYTYQYIKFKDIITIEYNHYTIYIISNNYFEVNQLNYTLSFLYADSQNIYIEYYSNNSDYNNKMDYNNHSDYNNNTDDNQTYNDNSYYNYSYYNLYFKFESYNNDTLYLFGTHDNYLVLDDCQANSSKILTCKIFTEKLVEILATNYEFFSVGAMNDNLGIYKFNFISPILININYIYGNKIDIFITLTETFGERNEIGIPFGFKTDVKNIKNLLTEKFNNDCYFKKVTGMNLLCLCLTDNYGYYKATFQPARYYNIHWKYNFIIQNYNSINSYSYYEGSDIKLIYPSLLDFSNNDILTIRFITPLPSYANNIKLNQYASDLACENLEGMKLCYVSFAHFLKNPNKFYFTYHSDYYSSTLYYGSSPIEVILPDINNFIELSLDFNNTNYLEQYLGKDNIIYFITNYYDNKNIFNDSSFSFNLKFNEEKNDNVFDASCHFWERYPQNVGVICKLNDNFIKLYDRYSYWIYLNENGFNYKEYKIIFFW